jgi:beta-lactamase regulating signal transducer with metallopeptidase domain
MIWWLTETTLVAAALAGAVALLCRRLRPRPAVRHALWLVVLLKLLTPPLLAWPWSAPASIPLAEAPAPRPPPAEEVVRWPAVEQATDETILAPSPEASVAALPPEPAPYDAAFAPVAEPGLPADPAPPTPEGQPVAIAAHSPAERWTSLLVVVWVGGAALTALLQAVRIARFRRRVACGEPAPAALAVSVSELAARIGVRPPPVVVLPGLASPVVWGLGRPRLLWPAALLGRLSPDGERTAIVHELAHLRRRDHWVGWLQLIASCVWWWSPLFWHVRGQVGRAAELACDAWVIEVLPKARRAYAQALLEVCELVSRRTAPAPALGMGGARQEIERRLTMILRESVPSRVPVRALFGVVLLALIALPGITGGQPAPDLTRTADPDGTKSPAQNVGQPGAKAPGDVAFFQPGAKAPADEREQRLRKLEDNLEALLKEVKELRGASAKQPAASGSKPAAGWSTEARQYEYVNRVPVEYKYWAAETPKSAPTPEHPIHLVRATYTLPKDKADALAALLKDLKAPVLEVQVKADTFVVTTTPEVDHVIGEFIGLLQGKVTASPNKPGYYAPSNYAPAKK